MTRYNIIDLLTMAYSYDLCWSLQGDAGNNAKNKHTHTLTHTHTHTHKTHIDTHPHTHSTVLYFPQPHLNKIYAEREDTLSEVITSDEPVLAWAPLRSAER